MMTRRMLLGLLLPFVMALKAEAQRVGKKFKLGILVWGETSVPREIANALRELHWIEGDNISFEIRGLGASQATLIANAVQLVASKVDIILASGTAATRAAKQATDKIPVLMVLAHDPIGNGLVTHLGHPEGNVTGVSALETMELITKRLQMLKEIIPNVSQVASIGYSNDEIRAISQAFDIRLIPIRTQGVVLEEQFQRVMKLKPSALIVNSTNFTTRNSRLIVALASEHHLPAFYPLKMFVNVGGLVSYGVDAFPWARIIADYVDKLLKGAQPSELPIQQPTNIRLFVNLQTAKALNIIIPPSLLAQAHEIIE